MSPAIVLLISPDNTSHVVAMLDLDAPGGVNGNKTYSPLLHWMAFIPPTQPLLEANASTANDIAPYIGPQPSVGTGMHRYTFLLYAAAVDEFQIPASFQKFNASDLNDRSIFNISGFAEDASLELVAAIGSRHKTQRQKRCRPLEGLRDIRASGRSQR